jgi:hypothetical protein
MIHIHYYSEQIMETELLKVKYLSHFDCLPAPNGPMKEEARNMKVSRPMSPIGRSLSRTEFSHIRAWKCKIILGPNVTRQQRATINFVMDLRQNQGSQIHASEQSATVSGLAGV